MWYDFLSKHTVRWSRQRITEDYKRTEVLELLGLKVIRFTNIEVDTNFEWVCEQIDFETKKRLNNC